jgi:DNA (cytosine-5)-methyltransferase 1
MRHGSLFSGIGGFDLAASWMGWENIFQIENDKFCIKKLEKNFPNVKRHGNIKEFDGNEYRGLIDILTGGFPCQGFSVAGKQRGKSDDRYLWPEMFRVIREIQPPWIVGENVPGIIKLALEDICSSLESEGYEVQPFIIPSASIGAWDKRERVWIIANINSFAKHLSVQQRGQNEAGDINPDREVEVNPDIKSTISKQSGKTRTRGNGLPNGIGDIISKGLQGHSRNDLSSREKEQERQTGQANWLRDWIEVASELCRSDAGVPHRMDRIKALGNSVNPYVVYEIFKAIEQTFITNK